MEETVKVMTEVEVNSCKCGLLSRIVKWMVLILSAPFVGTMLCIYAPVALLLWIVGRLLNCNLGVLPLCRWLSSTPLYKLLFPKPIRVVVTILWKLLLVVLGIVFWVIYFILFLILVYRDIGPTIKSIALPIAHKMGYEVSLETLEIAPLNGRVSIQGLRLENAKALVAKNEEFYKEDHAFVELGNFTIDVNIWSILTKDVHVREIRLEGLRFLMAWDKIMLEGEEYSVTNIDALLIQWGLKPIPTEENLAEANAVAEEAAEEAAEAAEEIAEEKEEERQEIEEAVAEGRMTREEAEELLREVGYTIDVINVEDNVITFVLPILPSSVAPAVPIPLPPYSASGVNDRSLRQKFEPTIERIAETYEKFEGLMEKVGSGLAVGVDALKDISGNIGEKVGDISENIGDAVSTLTEDVEIIDDLSKGLGKVTEGLGNIGSGAAEGIGTIGSGAVEGLGNLGYGAAEGVGNVAEGLGNLGSGAVEGLGNLGSKGAKSLSETASKLTEMISIKKSEEEKAEDAKDTTPATTPQTKEEKKKAAKEALKGKLKGLFD